MSLIDIALFLGFVGFILLMVRLGSGPPTSPQAPDTALSNPGSVGRDYGPLTERELEAHQELLRELDQ